MMIVSHSASSIRRQAHDRLTREFIRWKWTLSTVRSFLWDSIVCVRKMSRKKVSYLFTQSWHFSRILISFFICGQNTTLHSGCGRKPSLKVTTILCRIWWKCKTKLKNVPIRFSTQVGWSQFFFLRHDKISKLISNFQCGCCEKFVLPRRKTSWHWDVHTQRGPTCILKWTMWKSGKDARGKVWASLQKLIDWKKRDATVGKDERRGKKSHCMQGRERISTRARVNCSQFFFGFITACGERAIHWIYEESKQKSLAERCEGKG